MTENQSTLDLGSNPQPKVRVALFDISYIFRRHWHSSEDQPISEARSRTLAKVDRIGRDYDLVGICIDRPPYIRKQAFPEYKSGRTPVGEGFKDQIESTLRELGRWGYNLLGQEGHEADDVIATVCALASGGSWQIDVYANDKDIKQVLCHAGTRMIDPFTGVVATGFDVLEDPKLGVPPERIPDFLALTGDKSDALPGVEGCGPKTAAKWIGYFKTVELMLASTGDPPLANYMRSDSPLTPLQKTRVTEALTMIPTVKLLATLRTDCQVVIDDLQEPQSPANVQTEQTMDYDEESPPPIEDEHAPASVPTVTTVEAPSPVAEVVEPVSVMNPEELLAEANAETIEPEVITPPPAAKPGPSTAIVVRSSGSFDRHALEPRDGGHAMKLANILHNSRMFISKFPNEGHILAVMLEGRALGVGAIQALRGFNMIKGKPAPSSEMLLGIVMANPLCEYMICVETTDKQATWVTKRRGLSKHSKHTYTWEMAKRAGFTAAKQGSLSNWDKMPDTMCRWRCGTELVRMVYPDVTSGMRTFDEYQDIETAEGAVAA